VLLEGSWWTGPEHVLVIDDYDLTLTATGGPLGTLTDALGHARDIGFHVLLARRVAGVQRTAFEPFGQRLRELGPAALLLNGDRGEGPLAGDRTAGPQPPGRGLLVRRGRRDALVQCCLPTWWPRSEAER
jgi:DNA segregation ATPase FtsK/SpoIIIE, S-DNA-T family